MEIEGRRQPLVLGNLSMGIGMLVVLFCMIGGAGLLLTASNTEPEPDAPIYTVANNYITLMCLTLPLVVVGTIMGFAALFDAEKSRGLTIAGFLINLVYLSGVFLLFAAAVVIGLLAE